MSDIANIQMRLDAIAVAMAANGLREPQANYTLHSSAEITVLLCWREATGYRSLYEHPKSLDEAEAWVAALPTPEQARMTAFLTSLDETIQLGKKADVEVEAINPLLEIFKRISKNAITHEAKP